MVTNLFCVLLVILVEGVHGQTIYTIGIVSNPDGEPVKGSTNTYNYPILSNVTLTCNVTSSDGSIPTVTNYQWNTTRCPTCFPTGQTTQNVTCNNLLAKDAGTITCTVTIVGVDYISGPLTLRISGTAVTGASDISTDLVSINKIADYSHIIHPFTLDKYNATLRCATGLGPSGDDPNTELGGWFFNSERIPVLQGCGGPVFEVRQANRNRYPGIINLYLCGTFTPTEEGVYSCTMMNSSMMNQTMRVGLYLSERTAPMIDPPSPSTATVVVGSPLTLSCTSRGSPPDTFTWRKDSGPILNSTSITNVTHTNNSAVFRANYRINSVTTSDIGTYTCTVTNPIGSNSSNITITIGESQFTATILRSPNGTLTSESTYDYPILSNVTLICLATSRDGLAPTMTNYQWNTSGCFTNTKPIIPKCFPTGQNTQNVTGNNLLAEDAGTITCTVTIGGVDYTSRPLTLRISGTAVTGASDISTDLVSINKIADYSHITHPFTLDKYNATLRCASGLGPSGDDANTELGGWFFNSERIPVLQGCGGPVFEVRQANRKKYPGVINLYLCGTFTTTKEGVYSCTMMNSSMMNQTIRVGLYLSGRTAPVIDPPSPSTVAVVAGSPLILSCTSRSSPPDTFTWRKDSGPILNSTSITNVTHTRYSAVFRANYSINNVTTNHNGTYTCTVTNPIGSDSKNITVTVVAHCKVLTNVTNGKVSCSLGDDNVPTDGDTCSYTCNTGYMLSGDGMRACGNDGSWSNSEPTCKDVATQKCIITPVKPNNLTNGMLKDGTPNVTIKCSCHMNRNVLIQGIRWFSPDEIMIRNKNVPAGAPYFRIEDDGKVATLVIPVFNNTYKGTYTCKPKDEDSPTSNIQLLSIATNATDSTINDNSLNVSFNQSTYSVTEDAKLVQLVLVLSKPSPFNHSINMLVIDSNNTATGGDVDYKSGPYNVTFTKGSTNASINIPIQDDKILEQNETFTVAIDASSLPNKVSSSAPTNVTVNILDDDIIVVTFNQSAYSVNENDGLVQPVLVLSNPSSTALDIHVQNTASDETSAEEDVDYDSGPYIVMFPAGVMRMSFGVSIKIDKVLEDNETFTLHINDSLTKRVSHGNPNQAIITIVDTTSTIRFSQSTYRINEDDGIVNITLQHSNPSSTDINLIVNTTSINASGNDYNSGPYTVTIPVGQNDVTFSVIITADDVREMSETFNLIIDPSSLPNGVTSSNSATVIILDYDVVSVRIEQPMYNAGEKRLDRQLTIHLILSSTSSENITVTMNNDDDTAIGGVDYVTGPYRATFYAGMNKTSFIVTILDDNIMENNEQFQLSISSKLLPNRVTAGNPNQTTVTISDNDPIKVKFNRSTYNVSEDDGPAQPVLVLSNPSSTDITVKVSNKDKSTTGGIDYTSGSYYAIFPAGVTNSSINISIMNDNIQESDEQFQLNIEPLHKRVSRGNPKQITVTIIDDDAIKIMFSQTTYSVNEDDGPAQPVLVLSNPSSTDITVLVRDTQKTATRGGVDYDSGPYTVMIPAGVTSVPFDVPINDDNILEEHENFSLTIMQPSLPNGVTRNSSSGDTSISIMDNDDTTIMFNQSTYSINEDDGPAQPVLVLSNPSSIDIIVQVRDSQSTATGHGGVDYDSGPYNVTFHAGVTSVSFNVPINDDSMLEENENFNLMITLVSLPDRITHGSINQSAVSIVDNDVTTVKFSQSTYMVNENDLQVQPVVFLSNPSSSDITVQVMSNAINATGGGVDYNSGPYTVTFPAGDTSVSFNVTINDDNILEDDEIFNLIIANSLPSKVHHGNPSQTSVTIVNVITSAISFNKSTINVNESDGKVEITLHHTNPSSIDITFMVNSNSITASGSDYNSGPYTVTIPAGENDFTFSAAITDDDIREMSETFNLIIDPSSLPNGVTSSNNVTITILDHDDIKVQFSKQTYSYKEGSKRIDINLTLSNPSSSDIVLQLNNSDGTATGNIDYTSGPYNVTFHSGRIRETFNVSIIDDNILESNEQFKLSIVSETLPIRVGIGEPHQATLTIMDDDDITVNFKKSNYDVDESQKSVKPTLVLSNPSSINISITIDTRDITANGSDYMSKQYTVVFVPNVTEVSFTVCVFEDLIQEESESFILTITGRTQQGRVNIGKQNQTTVIIGDTTGKVFVEFSHPIYSGLESSGNISVTLSFTKGISTSDIKVKVKPSNQSPVSARGNGKDYNSKAITATFPPGKASITVIIPIKKDDIVEGTESFYLKITIDESSTGNASLGNRTIATGQIIDSTVCTVSFSHSTYNVSEDNGSAKLTLLLSNPTSIHITVNLNTSSNTASEDVDFNSGPYSVEFPSKVMTADIKVPIINDAVLEGTEIFDVTINIDKILPNGIKINVGTIGSTTVAIMDTTELATITDHPKPTTVYNSTTVILSCEATASGPITYQWRKSSGLLGSNSTTLTISSVTQDDEDEYYCTASYGVYVNGTSHVVESERAKVVVFGPPILGPLKESYYAIAEDRFELICNATNDEDSPNKITYTWFKDMKPLDSTNDLSITIDTSDPKLVIDMLNSKLHSGTYYCGAYNNHSSNSVFTNSASLIIEISKNFKESNVSGVRTNSINGSLFTSNVVLPSLDTLRNSYGPIGHLFVVVTTDNNTEPSQIPDNDLVDFNDPLRDTMYIAVVVHNTSGDQWEKMIVLGAGNITMSVDNSSYYNAPLDREKTYFTFVRAYAYDHSDSNPRYASSGYSQPIALPVTSSDGGGSSGGGGGAAIIGVVVVLIIIIIAIIIVIIVLLWYRKKYNKKEPTPAAVTNPITKEHIPLKEKSSVMLGPTETKSLPVVNIKEQEVKTSVGQPTTLYIEARGNPPPEISWTKNGLPVNDSLLQNGSLYIHSTTHSDQGTYTVTATSDEGSTSETIKLLVLNPQCVPSDMYKPIKVENFAEHLAMLHSSMNQQFTTDYSSLVMKNDFSFHTCKLEVNVMKNRYKNILPYDHSRVVLNLQDKLAGTDYINASFIDGYNERKAYIACQGPMASTMAEFWRMIWEQNVTAIVMVTNLVEEGKPKCQQYWPDAVNGSCTYGNISVTLQQEEVLAEYTIRTLAVKMIEASSEAKSVNLEVRQFHFTVWPDHGVPKYPTALLSFQKRVNKYHRRKRGSPLVVHCSAGVGRTGTFITIDMELQRIKHEAIVDVYNTVHKLRFRRNFTVQTLAQYVFIFDALMESIMCGDNSIAAPAKSAKLKLEELAKVNPATRLSGYESQFRKLQASSPNESDFQYISANLPENRHKNRSMKCLPPDNSRVFINTSGYTSDYICASYIDGYRHRRAFLAAEGPMNSTKIDFWAMVWERRSHAIVMLSLLEENGKEVSAKYWPDKGETMKIGPFVIETTTESKADTYFVRRIMQVTHAKEPTPRTINQFQHLRWPDYSCPSEASSIMDMVEIVEAVQRRSKNGPITVHCSDGLGRTGSFCALMLCHDRFKTEHMADVFYAIKTMRTQRPGMVENTAQYEFIHKTLKETMDRLDTYSNFDNQS